MKVQQQTTDERVSFYDCLFLSATCRKFFKLKENNVPL